MIDFDRALALVLETARPLPAESVDLEASDGRVLARDVRVRHDLPRFDQSSMDGYALHADDLVAGRVLRRGGEMPAGRTRRLPLRPGTAVQVFTGSRIPRDTAAILKVEDAEACDDGIRVVIAPPPGRYLRRRGEELARGERLLAAGTPITPPVLGLLAANGESRLRVHRRPDVALLVLGDELVAPGAPLEPGQIRDANGPALSAALRRVGVGRLRRRVVGDDPRALRRAMAREIARCDAVITVGGASVGDHDHVEDVRRALKVRERFHRVAMKPGKPNVFGTAPGGALMFGLPGNPVSALVSFHHFVAPALRRLAGAAAVAPAYSRAVLATSLSSTSARLEWVRGTVELSEGRLVARPTRGQESHMLSGLAAADALLELPRGVDRLPAGAEVRVRLLDW